MHILLDVDGVLQFKPPEFENRLVERLNWKGSYRDFLDAIFRSPGFNEVLCGKRDFVEVVRRLLPDHQPGLDPEQFLECWASDFALNRELLDRLAHVRCRSVSLASNQERRRGARIPVLYAQYPFIERSYLSYQLGYRKPQREFFETILNDLKVGASEMFFVDDDLENVDAARSMGIHAVQYDSNSQLCEALSRSGLL